jgi:hypothetical protein
MKLRHAAVAAAISVLAITPRSVCAYLRNVSETMPQPRVKPISAAPHRQDTLAQVIRREERLLRSLADGATLSISGRLDSNVRGKGKAWVIDGKAADGSVSVALFRDADTAELIYVAVTRAALPRPTKAKPLTSTRAVEMTHDMLYALGVATNNRGCELVGKPTWIGTSSGRGWTVTWKAGDRRAVVRVDAMTGRLVYAASYRPTARALAYEAQRRRQASRRPPAPKADAQHIAQRIREREHGAHLPSSPALIGLSSHSRSDALLPLS